jgi:hypothetical protein
MWLQQLQLQQQRQQQRQLVHEQAGTLSHHDHHDHQQQQGQQSADRSGALVDLLEART